MASAAMADGIDPTVKIRNVDPLSTPVTDPNQTFMVLATANNPVSGFQNQTGVTLTSISLTLSGYSLGGYLSFSCANDFALESVFSSCTSTENQANHSYTLVFSGVGGNFSGILSADCLTPSATNGLGWLAALFGCNNCQGGQYEVEFTGIPKGSLVIGTATVATPEPATAVMLLTGIVGLAGFARRRKNLTA